MWCWTRNLGLTWGNAGTARAGMCPGGGVSAGQEAAGGGPSSMIFLGGSTPIWARMSRYCGHHRRGGGDGPARIRRWLRRGVGSARRRERPAVETPRSTEASTPITTELAIKPTFVRACDRSAHSRSLPSCSSPTSTPTLTRSSWRRSASHGSPGAPLSTPGHDLACYFPRSPFGARVSHQIRRPLLSSLPATRAIQRCASWRSYNTHRPHQSLDQRPPAGGTPTHSGAATRVLRRDRLGGLLHEYVA